MTKNDFLRTVEVLFYRKTNYDGIQIMMGYYLK